MILKNTTLNPSIYENIFRYASVGMLIIDRDGVVVDVNQPFLQMIGYEEDEIKGNAIEKIVPQSMKNLSAMLRSEYESNLTPSGLGTGLEMFALKKDGTELLLQINLSKSEYENEKYIAVFVNEIDNDKVNQISIVKANYELETTVQNRTRELSRTLRTLELLNEKLETSLSYQKAILDNANVMLYVMNKQGVIKYFNPEAQRITGYSAEEIVNYQTPVIFHHPDEIISCKNELSEKFKIDVHDDFDVIKEKMLISHNQSIECEYVKKDGSLVPVMISIKAITDKSNNITGYLGLTVDITERKKAESKLLEALNKEKKLSELKSRFVSMASHEFRTPLSTVLSSAYLISKYITIDDQPKREKHINRIISSVNMLTDILNEFLSVGKIEEGKVSIRFIKIDLQKFIEELIMYIRNTSKKGQKFTYHHAGDPIVILDHTFLKIILINMLSNAIKFSAENQEIKIESKSETDEVLITISDSGIGISPEDQQHLMQRFFRGANAVNIQGTGLGLHIVSRYVEMMNGRVDCTSEINKGTTFTIRFNAKLNKHLFEVKEINTDS